MIIAEIGLNHNGSFDLASESVYSALQAGCDAVKFQTFITEDFVKDHTLQLTYHSQGKIVSESFYDLCKRHEFQPDWLIPLKKLCDEQNIHFIATPTSPHGVRDLANVGCSYVKNGSDFLGHLELLKEMAESGMHVIVSTGMSDGEDIDAAVNAMRTAPSSNLTLLHCTSSYPTQPENVNLRRMVSLREKFGVSVGYSDHTVGYAAAVQSVSLGATIIEKHFTLDHDLAGPDHWFSANPEEMRELVEEIRNAEARLGSSDVAPALSEKSTMIEYRLWVVAEEDIEPGAVLLQSQYSLQKIQRSARGNLETRVRPIELEQLRSRQICRPVKAGEPFLKGDFEQG